MSVAEFILWTMWVFGYRLLLLPVRSRGLRLVLSILALAFALWVSVASGLPLNKTGIIFDPVDWSWSLGIIIVTISVALLIWCRKAMASRFRDQKSDYGAYDMFLILPIQTVLLEEIFFRGVILGALLQWLPSVQAVVISAVMFGLWHVFYKRSMKSAGQDFIATSIGGLLLGTLRVASGGLLAPMVAHYCINVAGMILTRSYKKATISTINMGEVNKMSGKPAKSDKKLKSFRARMPSFSYIGILGAGLLSALSLTPSLLPRGILFQSAVSAVTGAIGYGLGVLARNTWLYLELPKPPKKMQKDIIRIVSLALFILLAVTLWKFVGWQNAVRQAVEMPERLSFWIVIPTLLLSALLWYLLILISRAIVKFFNFVFRWVSKVLSRRAAVAISFLVSFMFVVTLINGVLIRGSFDLVNNMYSRGDQVVQSDLTQPILPESSGSKNSFSSWDTLGKQGRKFVSTGPTVKDIEDFTGETAKQPVRAYVGLKGADTVQGQADLALKELKRSGAFDRDTLVIVSTTGTGWLDPNAVDPIEYMHGGDTAILGVQYSYLPSWISIFADQERVKETSQVVFETVHRYWRTLPESSRPKIYVYGLSLGSFGAESVFEDIDIINEPINGAVLSGPTFFNNIRNRLITSRDVGSPAWQPIIDKGRTARFTAEENALNKPTGKWQDVRMVYTANATDPVGWFSFNLAFSRPDWLQNGQRGPDITPEMRWMPIVTMWQVAADLPNAGNVPAGHGHTYGHPEMIDAWGAVTRPKDWSEAKANRLKEYFKNKTNTLGS